MKVEDCPVMRQLKRILPERVLCASVPAALTTAVCSAPTTSTLLAVFGTLHKLDLDHDKHARLACSLPAVKRKDLWVPVTCLVTHDGLSHVVHNAIVLAAVGPGVELALGPRWMGMAFIGCGFVGSLASMAALSRIGPSGELYEVCGASSSNYALMQVLSAVAPFAPLPLYSRIAALLGLGFVARGSASKYQNLPPMTRALWGGIWGAMVLRMLLGAPTCIEAVAAHALHHVFDVVVCRGRGGSDHSAHAGGALAGCIAGLAISARRGTMTPVSLACPLAYTAYLLVVAYKRRPAPFRGSLE